MRKYALPPLNLFHTFEVAARRGSFTLAAEELCLTQSAVSRQIKLLEDQCGVRLFRRQHKNIELTQEGRDLYLAVSRGLDEISACLSSYPSMQGFPQITVSASVAFSYYWLMPRLEAFTSAHPEIDLRVLATDQAIDLHHNEADIAILYGTGCWDEVYASHLFDECVYPVCSPGYAENHVDMTSAGDLLNKTLLHLEGGGNIWGSVDWRVWLSEQNVAGSPERRGIRLNSYPMVLQAAQAGRGVALGWSYIVDDMINSGLLVRPIESAFETEQGYYVGALEQNCAQPATRHFIQWVIEEAARS
ncbi:MAG: LysR family transcriptional regulator [Gammaproteobacteria bacterium]|nr:LysR family transcriptional regulator [Gammaproteobacteria bacterium]